MRRMSAALMGAALVLGAPVVARAEIVVVAVQGRVQVTPARGDHPPRSGTAIRDGARVHLASWDAGLQLVVRRLSVGLWDSAVARLADGSVDLGLVRGVARVSGEGLVASGPLTLELAGTCTLRAERGGYELLLVRGRGRVVAPRRGGSDPTLVLSPGRVLRVEPGGAMRFVAPVPPELRRVERRYVAPPVWEPPPAAVDLRRQVRQIRGQVERERERERDMASCGCTEGTGPTAGPVQGPNSLVPLERRQTQIRVHVTSVPKKL